MSNSTSNNRTGFEHGHLIHFTNPILKFSIACLLLAIFTLSLTENLMIFIAVCRPRIRKRQIIGSSLQSRHFIANLCLANLLLTTVIPFSFHAVFAKSELLKSQITLAQFLGFFVALFISAMTISISIITLVRNIVIFRPLNYQVCLNRSSMLFLSLIGWFLSILLASIPFIASVYIKELPYTFLESHSFFFLVSCSSHLFYRYYLIVFVILVYACPLIFIIVTYLNVYSNVKRMSRNIGNRSSNYSKKESENCNYHSQIRHSISSPNLIQEELESMNSFTFSSKKSLLQAVKSPDHSCKQRLRKISANSFFRSQNNSKKNTNSPVISYDNSSQNHPNTSVNGIPQKHPWKLLNRSISARYSSKSPKHSMCCNIERQQIINTKNMSVVTQIQFQEEADSTLISSSNKFYEKSRKLSKETINSSTFSANTVFKKSRQRIRTLLSITTRQKEELTGAITCIIIVTTFALLVTPYFTLVILQAFHTQKVRIYLDIWNTISVLLLYFNCFVTPGVYVYRDSILRSELLNLYHCITRHQHNHPPALTREASLVRKRSHQQMEHMSQLNLMNYNCNSNNNMNRNNISVIIEKD